MEVGKDLIDGINGASGAQYMNTGTGTKRKHQDNASFSREGNIKVRNGKSDKEIKNGTEILIEYGKLFWSKMGELRKWEEEHPDIIAKEKKKLEKKNWTPTIDASTNNNEPTTTTTTTNEQPNVKTKQHTHPQMKP